MNKNIIYYLLAVAGLGVTIWYILHNPNQRHYSVVDPRLQPYVAEWRQDMLNEGFDPDNALSSLETIAVTEMENVGNTEHYTRKIYVSEQAFLDGDATVRAAVYHELGHYVFGLQHGQCELMSEKSWPNPYYEDNWNVMKGEYIQLIRSQEFETHY